MRRVPQRNPNCAPRQFEVGETLVNVDEFLFGLDECIDNVRVEIGPLSSRMTDFATSWVKAFLYTRFAVSAS